jgi:1-acyl-sn-glycerol-3-phosphate acyltransferase
MLRFLAKLLFKISGWKVVGNIPPHIKKCIMIAAPHTSNWDFIWARGAFYILRIKVRFTIKKEFMKFPFGGILNAMGALPVDRSKNNSLVNTMIDMVIMITPEGTRSYQPRWRKGFYHTAFGANVPIILGYLDYKKKEAGIGDVFIPTGDVDADIEKIKDFYRTKSGKYPENGVR